MSGRAPRPPRPAWSRFGLWGPTVVLTLPVVLYGLGCGGDSTQPTTQTVSPTQSTVSSASSVVSGLSTTITVTVKDPAGSPIQGKSVSLAIASGGKTGDVLVQPASPTNQNGTTTGTFTGLLAGSRTISASVGQVDIVTVAVVGVTAGPVSATASAISATSSIISGGAPSTITVTAKDAAGNPLAGEAVTLQVNPPAQTGDVLTQPSGVTGADGTATGSLAATAAGTRTIRAMIGAVSITPTASVVVNGGPVSADQSTVVVTSPVPSGTSSPVVITAKDAAGNLLSGQTASFTVSGPATGVTAVQPAAPTDASGVATGSVTVLMAGMRTITASVGTVTLASHPSLVVVEGPVSGANSSISIAPPPVAGAGASTITVVARDIADNPVPQQTVTLSLTAGAQAGDQLTQPAAATDPSGTTTGSFSATAPGSRTVTVTIGGSVVLPLAFQVTPANVSASLSTVTASSPIVSAGSSVITVTVKSTGGTPVPGAAVSLAITSGAQTGDVLTQPAAATDQNGVATGSFTGLLTGAARLITATVGTVTITQTATISVSPGPVSAATSTVTAAPSITSGGAAGTITITARDGAGNLLQGQSVTLSITSGGQTGDVLTQPAANTGSDGVTTGSLAASIAGPRVVTAMIGATTVTQTAAIQVNPGPVSANTSTVTASSPVTAGGTAGSITVTARDAAGNLIAGQSVTLAVTAGGQTGDNLVQPAGTTSGQGVATGSFAATKVGTPRTITATIGSTAITQTASIVVDPGPVSASASSLVAASPITAGGAGSVITVTARDDNGNVIPNATVTLSVSSGGQTGDTLTQPAATNASGVATGALTAKRTGARVVSAIIGATSVTQTAGVTVNPGPTGQISAYGATAQTAPPASPAPQTPGVIVRDAFGNPLSGVTVTFAVTAGGGSTSPANGQVATGTDGVARLTSWTMGASGTNTVQASVAGSGVTGNPVSFSATLAAAGSILTSLNGGTASLPQMRTPGPFSSLKIVQVFGSTTAPLTVSVGAVSALTPNDVSADPAQYPAVSACFLLVGSSTTCDPDPVTVSSTTTRNLRVSAFLANNVGEAGYIYSGSLPLTSPQAAAPLTVAFDIRTQLQTRLMPDTAGPSGFEFSSVRGAAPPPAATLNILEDPDAKFGEVTDLVPPTASDAWIVTQWVPADATTTPAVLQAAIDTTALPSHTPGTYYGTITVTCGSCADITVPVSYTLLPPPTLALATTTLALSARAGDTGLPPASILVSNTGGGSLTGLTAAVVYQSPASPPSWLTATFTGGTTANPTTTLALTPDAAALAAGTYTARVDVTAPGSPDQVQSVLVTLTVLP